MFKKIFSAPTAFAFSLFLIAPGYAAEEVSVTVDVPVYAETADEVAARDAAILAAAEQVCDDLEFVGISKFYSSNLKKTCVADAVKTARIQTPDGQVLAYADLNSATLD